MNAIAPQSLPVARNTGLELALLPALANRHGLITGATGTGINRPGRDDCHGRGLSGRAGIG